MKTAPRPTAHGSTNIPPLAACAIIIAFVVFAIVAVNQSTTKAEKRVADAQAHTKEVLHDMGQQAHQQFEANSRLASQHKVRVGMSDDQCRIAWGEPERVNRTTDANGEHEQWVYRSGNALYLTDSPCGDYPENRSRRGGTRSRSNETSHGWCPGRRNSRAFSACATIRDHHKTGVHKNSYGTVALQIGTKLPLVSHSAEKARIRYLDGTDYDIPISSTDVK